MSKSTDQAPLGKDPNAFGMVTTPTEQFKRMVDRPNVLKALLLVSFITIISGLVIFFSIGLTVDPILSTLTKRELFDVLSFNIVNNILIVLVTIIVYSLIHLLAAKVVKSPVSLVQLLAMNAHIAIIPALGLFINAVLYYIFKGSTTLDSFTSLSNFVKTDGILKAALGPFELFMIWQFVLMAIGLQKLAKFPAKATWVIIILFFFLLVSLEIAAAGSVVVK